MKLLINDLNEIIWRLTSEKLSLYPLEFHTCDIENP